MKIEKNGSAHWSGGLKDGKGEVSTQSGALASQPYGFKTRFEGVAGTNPEELLGAAHAACFTMALSLMLEQEGLKADSIDTKAVVTLEAVEGGFGITGVALSLRGVVPGATEAQFTEAANKAKAGCPVSKALASVPITLAISFG